MHPGPNAPANPRFDRLILSNILEWAQQPERQPLPQFSALPGSQRFPEEEMAMYWSGDRKIVVARHPVDDTHIADISAILGYENLIFRTVASGQPGHSVCADLAADERALSDVFELLDNSPADGPVTVEAFGSTPQYSHLVTIIGKNSRRPVIDHGQLAGPQLEHRPGCGEHGRHLGGRRGRRDRCLPVPARPETHLQHPEVIRMIYSSSLVTWRYVIRRDARRAAAGPGQPGPASAAGRRGAQPAANHHRGPAGVRRARPGCADGGHRPVCRGRRGHPVPALPHPR